MRYKLMTFISKKIQCCVMAGTEQLWCHNLQIVPPITIKRKKNYTLDEKKLFRALTKGKM